MSNLSVKPGAMTSSTITLETPVSVVSDITLDRPAVAQGAHKKRVLLVASSGGHWVQMNRIKQAFDGEDLYFASTEKTYCESVPEGKFFYVPEASKSSSMLHIIWQAVRVLLLILRIRPEVVVSTGAAPGYFAVLFAKKLGAKTIWVDSIANVDKISLSGRKAAKHTDLFITQWEHLAKDSGAAFFGSVV